jgi:hypothetical protein
VGCGRVPHRRWEGNAPLMVAELLCRAVVEAGRANPGFRAEPQYAKMLGLVDGLSQSVSQSRPLPLLSPFCRAAFVRPADNRPGPLLRLLPSPRGSRSGDEMSAPDETFGPGGDLGADPAAPDRLGLHFPTHSIRQGKNGGERVRSSALWVGGLSGRGMSRRGAFSPQF